MLALLEPKNPVKSYFEGFSMKVKVRLMGTEKEVTRLRNHLLKKHPQMILAKPQRGNNPRYDEIGQKWFVYGDYEFGKIRRRRSN